MSSLSSSLASVCTPTTVCGTVVFSVVDALIPRAETLAKSKIDQQRSKKSTPASDEPQHKYESLHYYPQLTEMHVGMFDLSPYEQQVTKQVEKETEAPKVDISAKLNQQLKEETSHHHITTPKFFWGSGK